ncbi:MAG: riboflavin synthase [Armatimonadetes bacterium]|nr:riboflavin synthase [Armatimonadota bacterium]
MFTGIIEAVGAIRRVIPAREAVRLEIAADVLFNDVALGESVAVSGVCLTVAASGAGVARFDVVPETIRRTKLGELKPGDPVNLERALRPTDRLGGHFVQGHVDGVGRVHSLEQRGGEHVLTIAAPREVTDYLVDKGSVAVDGASLTVVAAERDRFSVALIPHTLAATTLGRLRPGDRVNVEADLIGKHVARYLARQTPREGGSDAEWMRRLRDEGFA